MCIYTFLLEMCCLWNLPTCNRTFLVSIMFVKSAFVVSKKKQWKFSIPQRPYHNSFSSFLWLKAQGMCWKLDAFPWMPFKRCCSAPHPRYPQLLSWRTMKSLGLKQNICSPRSVRRKVRAAFLPCGGDVHWRRDLLLDWWLFFSIKLPRA